MVDVDEVYMVILDDGIEILPLKSDLKKFVDSVEVDIPEVSYLDYHKLRKELRREFK